jgi:hypothetical protein
MPHRNLLQLKILAQQSRGPIPQRHGEKLLLLSVFCIISRQSAPNSETFRSTWTDADGGKNRNPSRKVASTDLRIHDLRIQTDPRPPSFGPDLQRKWMPASFRKSEARRRQRRMITKSDYYDSNCAFLDEARSPNQGKRQIRIMTYTPRQIMISRIVSSWMKHVTSGISHSLKQRLD